MLLGIQNLCNNDVSKYKNKIKILRYHFCRRVVPRKNPLPIEWSAKNIVKGHSFLTHPTNGLSPPQKMPEPPDNSHKTVPKLTSA